MLPCHHAFKSLRNPLLALSTKIKSLSPCSSLSAAPSTRSKETHADLLAVCSISQSLRRTKQCHALGIVGRSLPRSVSLCASLILSYAGYGDIAAGRVLFRQTFGHCHTAFLWNTLIRAHSVCGAHDGFETYNAMIRSGVRPDGHTFPFVFKVCADFVEVKKGMEIHVVVFKLGFNGDVYVGNTLLQFYGNCGDLRGAEKVFDEMAERDVVSWNTVIGVFSVNGLYEEAFEFFNNMNSRSGMRPNMVSVISVLPVCAGLEDEVMASQIHAYTVKVGLVTNVTVGNALVDAYAKCGNGVASRHFFDKMVEKNEVSWNAIITGFAYGERNVDALVMFRSMVFEGLKPDSVTISSMLPVLVELQLFDLAKEVHAYSIRMGVETDLFISNSLIDMYAKSGHPTEASRVFNKMKVYNVVSWNAMIANFTQNRREVEAINLIREMQVHGEVPSSLSFTNVLPACARMGLLSTGKEIHARTFRMGESFDVFISNALTDMYAKCGCLNLARKVFSMSQRDEVTYNILIVGYSQTSYCLESLSLLKEMHSMGMNYDIVSFVGAISACANTAAIKHGKEIHGLLVRKQFHMHLFVANSLLDLYMKCGKIDIAGEVFDRMPYRDVASWNTMIMGYGMLGEIETAINLFEEMMNDGVEYDSVSFIAVLSACSHGGLIEKGREYFKEMRCQNLEPTQMHYACMVDLLGRAGLFEEALELIKGLAFKPDVNIWGALLGACRMHGNIELGCWAADHLFKLKPDHCGYYVLLSNLFAEAGRWDEADRVRELMKSRAVKKNPGFSWVQTRDKVHAFVVGEKVDDLDPFVWLAEAG
ncbi:pentatricopeptide repeat-containing protein At4g14170-like [Rhodamnia argentea]|uniref:Pentatricopeptide repeat-containing protein At4g14170-like n=1 Tax=Rhodamnia argentea TaxID=178133 RepID=A0A8B8NIE4_9MYRT|nr:pentatricopeptide repeat-containing protein At4g14170-like [Rhodamnia argentea]